MPLVRADLLRYYVDGRRAGGVPGSLGKGIGNVSNRKPKYVLSTLPEDTPLERLVVVSKMRRRIEWDYREFKQELGLGHYEGRSWRGCITTRRCALPPTDCCCGSGCGMGTKKPTALGQAPALPPSYRPRGAATQPATRPRLDRHATDPACRAYRSHAFPMSVLR